MKKGEEAEMKDSLFRPDGWMGEKKKKEENENKRGES